MDTEKEVFLSNIPVHNNYTPNDFFPDEAWDYLIDMIVNDEKAFAVKVTTVLIDNVHRYTLTRSTGDMWFLCTSCVMVAYPRKKRYKEHDGKLEFIYNKKKHLLPIVNDHWLIDLFNLKFSVNCGVGHLVNLFTLNGPHYAIYSDAERDYPVMLPDAFIWTYFMHGPNAYIAYETDTDVLFINPQYTHIVVTKKIEGQDLERFKKETILLKELLVGWLPKTP